MSAWSSVVLQAKLHLKTFDFVIPLFLSYATGRKAGNVVVVVVGVGEEKREWMQAQSRFH